MPYLMKISSLLIVSAVLSSAIGCFNEPVSQQNADTNKKTNSTETATQSKTDSKKAVASQADFSTPAAAVTTFAKAAVDKDIDLLAECMHASCAGEFQTLRDKSTDAEMLDQLAELFTGAIVGKAKLDGNQAYVQVKLTSRGENLTMAKSDSGWKLVDF